MTEKAQDQQNRKKSFVSEAALVAFLGALAIVAKNYIAGGFDAISDSAITALVSTGFTLGMQIFYKYRNGYKLMPFGK